MFEPSLSSNGEIELKRHQAASAAAVATHGDTAAVTDVRHTLLDLSCTEVGTRLYSTCPLLVLLDGDCICMCLLPLCCISTSFLSYTAGLDRAG